MSSRDFVREDEGKVGREGPRVGGDKQEQKQCTEKLGQSDHELVAQLHDIYNKVTVAGGTQF